MILWWQRRALSVNSRQIKTHQILLIRLQFNSITSFPSSSLGSILIPHSSLTTNCQATATNRKEVTKNLWIRQRGLVALNSFPSRSNDDNTAHHIIRITIKSHERRRSARHTLRHAIHLMPSSPQFETNLPTPPLPVTHFIATTR